MTALDGIDLALNAGEITLLMGPSGSGKSSLISVLGGLQAPDDGSVMVMGDDLWGQSSGKITKFRRKNCGFVFQSVGLFPALTAFEQIVLPLKHMGFDTKTANSQAKAVLAEVDLAERAHSRPNEMSGGENQRVAIARMLAKDPKLIFCDEPTSALDTENGAAVAQLLRQAAKTHNAMVFCVTHDDRLIPFADRILKIEDGQIISDSQKDIT
ncbi:MAG: ABC transporter ATP-binding protein [Robiginitomaculum sp.]|nr:ABC transporter ATP-binding protein [Robiginitomaculum sp.]